MFHVNPLPVSSLIFSKKRKYSRPSSAAVVIDALRGNVEILTNDLTYPPYTVIMFLAAQCGKFFCFKVELY